MPERKTPAQATAPAPKPVSAFAAPPPTFATAPSFTTPQPTVAPTAAIELYYKSLRSLNLALLDSLQQETARDVFVDLAPTLNHLAKQYTTYRSDLEASYRSKFTVKPATPAAVPAPVAPQSYIPTPATTTPAPPKIGMPVPPAKFTFGSGEPIKSTTPTSTPGFVPTGAALKKGSDTFKFPEKAVVPGVEAQKEKAKFSPVAPSPLRFGASPPVVKKVEETTKSAFSFGATYSGIIADPKSTPAPPTAAPLTPTATATFSFNAPPSSIPSSLSTAKTLPPAFVPSVAIPISTTIPSLAFGTPSAASPPLTASFGAGSSPTASAFAFGAGLRKEEIVKSSPGAGSSAGFSFGAPKAGGAAFAFGGATSAPFKSTAGFSLGAPASSVASKEESAVVSSPFGSTSALSTSAATTSTPFGFNTPSTISSGSASPMAAAPSTGFSFGSSAPATTLFLSVPPPVAAAVVEGAPQEEPDGSSEMISSAKPVSGGEGEEGEAIVHHVRGKVWTIKDGISTEMGVAGIWIKEKEGVKRLLARNEVTGNVLIVCHFSPFLSLSLDATAE